MYVVEFIRSDGAPNEEYWWNTYDEANHQMSLFNTSDRDMYKEIIMLEIVGSDVKVIKRKEMTFGMYLLNSKPVLECEEEEFDVHSREIDKIYERIQDLPNFDCAVVIRYLDEGHLGKQHIEPETLHDVFEILERGDLKNGVDVYLDENGYLNLISYGQGYVMNGKEYMVTTSYQILPYDENQNFLDISKALLKQGYVEISKQQFDEERGK